MKPGYELALAAALGGRLDAALVRDIAGAAGAARPRRPGRRAPRCWPARPRASSRPCHAPQPSHPADSASHHAPHRARSALDRARCAGRRRRSSWLAGCSPTPGWSSAWRISPRASQGIAVTRSGRVLFAGWGEVRQITEGGAERVLAQRNERERLIAESERAVARPSTPPRTAAEQALERARSAERSRATGRRRPARRPTARMPRRRRPSGAAQAG